MGTYVNPGNDSFALAVQSSIYVDKTGVLEYTNRVFGTEQRCICVSRPRRFGKSMAAGMLAAYYSKGCDSRELFSGFKIAQSEHFEKFLNQCNVIHLDMTDFKGRAENAKEVLDLLHAETIHDLKELYPGVLREQDDYLPRALKELNTKLGESFVIIIDEWDMIFREYPKDTESQKEYVDLLRGLFKAETSKRFTRLAYLTGILPIKRYNSESALNNFDEFTMTSPRRLAEYIGFTEDEVQALCEEYDMDFEEAKRWYDGYSFLHVHHVYSPNSVVKAMLSGEYENYWIDTVDYRSLTDLITMNFDGLKDCILQLLAGERVRVNVGTFENDMTTFYNRDDVLTLLIHLGYLAYDKGNVEAYIPNEEVKTSFYRAISATNWTPVLEAIRESDALMKATIEGDADAVAAGIDAVHMANTSILNYNDENALSCVITLAYYNAINDYTIERELPAGKGYADMVFRPRKYSGKPAMVVELKYDKTAEGAIAQIREKKYAQALQGYQGEILLVGINYDKETKQHTCVIEQI